MKIILVNGPPRVGKDEFYQQAIVAYWNEGRVIQRKFATPLYKGIQALFGLEEYEWADIYNNHKESPCSKLHGMSPRQAMIWLSEEVMKPKFGKNVFGHSLVSSITDYDKEIADYCIVTDSGFIDEAKVVVDSYGVENVILVNVSRNGHTFENDSRHHVSIDDIGGDRENAFSITNNGTLGEYQNEISKVFQSIKEKK